MKVHTVSVVVPAYNEEKYIIDTLKSLRNQSYPEIELIVVDNDSTDKTADISREYADRVLFEKKQGEAYARCHGIQEAAGDFIVSCDADTFYPSDHVEKIVETLGGENVVGVHGYLDIGDRLLNNWYHFFVLLNRVWGFPQVGASNMAFKKKYFRGFETRYPHSFDILLSKHLWRQGEFIYRPDLRVLVSNRRLKDAAIQATIEHGKNYLGLLILNKPLMHMTDVR